MQAAQLYVDKFPTVGDLIIYSATDLSRNSGEASGLAGINDLPCVIADEDDLHANLAMIDENLCRADLGPAEVSLQTTRRKVIYKMFYPETTQAKAGGRPRNEIDPNLGSISKQAAFIDNTAAATGG